MRPAIGRALGSRGGYALAVVVIIMFALGVIAASFIALAGYETRASHTDLAKQRAFWLAEAGKERALRWMASLTRPPETDVRIYTAAAGPDGGSYTVDCLVDSAGIYQVEKWFVLDCVGRSEGVERRIRQRIRMTSFAQYAYFTDDERTPGGQYIWFISADQIHGLVHSNGTFRIAGSPRFFDEVTSAANRMIGYQNYSVYDPSGWPVGGNAPVFDESFRLNVPSIPLPTQTLDLKAEAQSGGLFLAPASTIELGKLADGTVTPGWLRYRNTPPPNGPWTGVRISSLGKKVVYVNNPLEVSGRLDGEVTIGCLRDITIVDDITYWGSSAAGTPPPGCDDLLGLVAERNIIFDNSSATVDLKINAVLMALNTSITAEDYGTRPPCGNLTIWGGLIQKYRGPVGTFRNGVLQTGYAKDYHYDTRVTARTPPAFPLTGVYQEASWMETWDASYPF
ncbi:MAG: DUF4900 domain-containing protein [Candidatus Eisenbacteria bacterium]|nr:DUF4900 domain-containing protein [Candidatus Eisenbacteria bacterium]